MDLIDNPDGLFLDYQVGGGGGGQVDLLYASPSDDGSSSCLSSPASAPYSTTGGTENLFYSEPSPSIDSAHTIVFDDFFMEEWQNQNFNGGSGAGSELGQQDLAAAPRDDESDSGLSSTSSSSSSNSPSTILSSATASANQEPIVFDSGVKGECQFAGFDLRDIGGFDALLQSMSDSKEAAAPPAEDIIELPEDMDDTEALLNNIEMLLNSMPDMPDVEQPKPAAKTAQQRQQQRISELKAQLMNKKIKQEPTDAAKALFKKISPKSSANNKVILPKPSGNGTVTKPTAAVGQVPFQIAAIPVQSVLTVPLQLQMQPSQAPNSPAAIIIKSPQTSGPAASAPAANLMFKPIQIGQLPDSASGQPIIIAATTTADSSLVNETATTTTGNKKMKLESPPVVKQPAIVLAQKPVTTVQPQSITTKIQLSPKPSDEPRPAPVPLTNPNVDPNILKKQSRMIKNRESACLSRKRKKEHMETLEDNLKDMTHKYESLKQENQTLRERVLVLEAENKVLREHQQQQTTIIRTLPVGAQTLTKLPISSLNSIKTTMPALVKGASGSGSSVSTAKRPFIALAIFLVFGINIFQFVNVNLNNGPGAPSYPQLMGDKSFEAYSDMDAVQLAALAAAQARDGALIDPQNAAALLKQQQVHLNSRRLLSDAADYDDVETSPSRDVNMSKLLEHAKKQFNITDVQMPSNESMELVKINGTWHLVDLNICYQMMLAASSGEPSSDPKSKTYFNQTHVNRINSELNRWFERHAKGLSTNHKSQQRHHQSSAKVHRSFNEEAAAAINTNSHKLRQQVRKQVSDRIIAASSKDTSTTAYPVSVYDTNVRAQEKFTESIRKRNDTFYYISFRRDHVIIPPVISQTNKTLRPRMSLLMPALLTKDMHLNGSSKVKDENVVAFMQIDCEVTDTRLFYLNKEDIPLDYLKILALNDQMTTPTTSPESTVRLADDNF